MTGFLLSKFYFLTCSLTFTTNRSSQLTGESGRALGKLVWSRGSTFRFEVLVFSPEPSVSSFEGMFVLVPQSPKAVAVTCSLCDMAQKGS